MELKLSIPGLKCGSLIVKFLRSGKILVVPEGAGFHFTLHPGSASGSVDIHRTNEHVSEDDDAKYETLVTVPREDILEKIRQLGPNHIPELLTLLRPIRIGWIGRRRLGVVGFPTDSDLKKVSGIRLTDEPVDSANLLTCWMCTPEFLDEIPELPNDTFLLFNSRRPASPLYGLLFKLRVPENDIQLRWIKFRDLLRWSGGIKAHFMDILGGDSNAEERLSGRIPEAPLQVARNWLEAMIIGAPPVR